MSVVKDNYVDLSVQHYVPQPEPTTFSMPERRMSADDALRASAQHVELGAPSGGEKGAWKDSGHSAATFHAEERFEDGVRLRVQGFMRISGTSIVVRWHVMAHHGDDTAPADAVHAVITCMESSCVTGCDVGTTKASFEYASSRSANRCVARVRAAIAAREQP